MSETPKAGMVEVHRPAIETALTLIKKLEDETRSRSEHAVCQKLRAYLVTSIAVADLREKDK